MSVIPKPRNDEYFIALGRNSITGDFNPGAQNDKYPHREIYIEMSRAQIETAVIKTNFCIDNIVGDMRRMVSPDNVSDIHSEYKAIVLNMHNWERAGHIDVTNVDLISSKYLEQVPKSIEIMYQIKSDNISVLKKIKDDLLEDENPIVLEENSYHHNKIGIRTTRLSQVLSMNMMRIVDALRCPKCKTPVKRVCLDAHLIHPECNITRDIATAKSKNLVLLDFYAALSVRLAGIETDMIPSKYDIYGPEWVVSAIDAFRTGGYAGMSLAEFLKKINPIDK